ncbi:MAG: hypothetical protein ACT4PO_10280 [Actinomycetota bacterium]
MGDAHRMLIGGGWVASEGGGAFEAASPSRGDVFGTVPEGTRKLKTVVVNMG